MRYLLIVLLCGFALEGLLRLVPYQPRIADHIVYDPVLGHKGPAGAIVPTPFSLLHYSHEGMRLLPPVPNPKRKIAILGDSFTEAFTLRDEIIFPTLLQQALGHAEVRIYAAGDWGSTQELLAWREFAQKWKPDLVLLQFTVLNDFLNNDPSDAGLYQSRMDSVRPYGGLEIRYLNPFRKALLDHSTLARWIGTLYLGLAMRTPKPVHPDCHRNPHLKGVEVYRTARAPGWEHKLAETAQILKQLKAEVGPTRLVSFFLPNPLELEPKKFGDVVEGPLALCFGGLPRPQPREGERKFFDVMKKAGIEAISLFDSFEQQQKSAPGEALFIYDGHLDQAGHALTARELQRRVFTASP